VSADDPRPSAGWIEPDLAEELPGLRLLHLTVDRGSGRSPDWIRQRLRDMSSRFRGAQAVAMRQDPIPHAYRVFYRHVGLDPDAQRTPIEAAAVERLLRGAFKSQNLLDDALTIALMETGVPIWALDAARVEGGLGLRVARDGERLGRGGPGAPPVASGRIVVADERSPLAVLFGDLAPGHGVTPETTAMVLFAVQVAGVPPIHVEEAFWTCLEVLSEG
jgi:DNA/RNA-binding domain of Phe-tRNA-synthetase-like protein